jgi:mRNA interferase RelE/StbE
LSHRVLYRSVVLERDLPSFPRNIQERILRAIEQRLITAPDRFGRRLRRTLLGLWRIRVGDYRVIYEIRGHDVHIWAIGHRRDAYDEMAKRWASPGV